jgi:hypothetical protein
MVAVSVPSTVHVTPSGEMDAVKVEPERTSCTRYGAMEKLQFAIRQRYNHHLCPAW